jgi:hypothetical protein
MTFAVNVAAFRFYAIMRGRAAEKGKELRPGRLVAR